ncbi:hypothetical protein [Paenibacillus crassostreae]|uniref:Uncharacterized protein n=1 Tax=Paenibacillus crassostreae TaxID=1763538 RepID=A0A167FTU4_9BACL|nr:hypothetical protein [Paenibacillus crassostreae]AOZ94071.1 hypothetical protein LPB68_19025 [Paenibacillus crassostreae]OAB76893.1 hypothetical protein PNBC_05715 [Paenibacillus crassostreae]
MKKTPIIMMPIVPALLMTLTACKTDQVVTNLSFKCPGIPQQSLTMPAKNQASPMLPWEKLITMRI